MDKYYRIFDKVYKVTIEDDYNYDYEGYLAPFVCDICDYDYLIDIKVVESISSTSGELVYESNNPRVYKDGNKEIRLLSNYQKIIRDRNQIDVEYKGNKVTSKTVLNSMMIEHMIVENHGILLHSSYINVNGEAILFTAPSGTGKSTQADLWNKYRNAELINGDRCAIKMIDGVAYAYGIPFSGSSGICKDVKLPIRAIVYLGQATETSIIKLRLNEAFRRIYEGCSINLWNKDDINHCIDSITQLISCVPVYYMACTPDIRAVEALEKEVFK